MSIPRLFLFTLPLLLASCGQWGDTVASMRGGHSYLAGYNGGRQHDWKSSPIPDDVSYWDGDHVQGSPSIRIHLGQQKAFFYKGGALVGVSKISTGKEGNSTRPGTFKVIQKSPNHRSSLYGVFKEHGTGRVVNDDVDTRKDKAPPGAYYEGAAMFHFLRFDGGIGTHEGYLPGYAASHGCVRMPAKMAKKFYDNAPLGTPVIVE